MKSSETLNHGLIMVNKLGINIKSPMRTMEEFRYSCVLSCPAAPNCCVYYYVQLTHSDLGQSFPPSFKQLSKKSVKSCLNSPKRQTYKWYKKYLLKTFKKSTKRWQKLKLPRPPRVCSSSSTWASPRPWRGRPAAGPGGRRSRVMARSKVIHNSYLSFDFFF